MKWKEGSGMATATAKKTYTKGQLLEAKKYAGKRDLLSAILSENKKYTLEDVDKTIERYTKGKVN